MMSVMPQDGDCPAFAEVDPTGRYGRYSEILGKGASKTVYRAFDEYEGMEVAWNQVKLHDFLQSTQDLERLYCEIHLLKTLKHKNIMKLYASWIDTSKRNINFITEMFTSGTLRQYRLRHRRVNIRAVKNWCRQILMGLVYLHSHDPPVIHRDLKCDNIFINGNQGEVKIGDLGLAAILRKSQAVHCVGTPEFMAPEVYEEEYNELVDIYSFGMCVLEMVTLDYPYSECTHPAQIYKKVISGAKPEALYKIEDSEVRQFVEKCLVTASQRMHAWELLMDPFLHVDGLSPVVSNEDVEMKHLLRPPFLSPQKSNGSIITNNLSGAIWDYTDDELEIHDTKLFNYQGEENFGDVDITIKGRRKEDGEVLFRLRITDRDGHVRNIYFPFDVKADTPIGVAAEMVSELDITDCEVTRIAEMIDGELSLLVHGWKTGPGIDESPSLPLKVLCDNCASNVSSYGSLLDFLSSKNHGGKNLQPFYCSNIECAAMHGRFEEITYQVDAVEESAISVSNSDRFDSCEDASERSHLNYYDLEEINAKTVGNHQLLSSSLGVEHKNEIKAKNLVGRREALLSSPDHRNLDKQVEDWKRDHHLFHRSLRTSKGRTMKSFHQSNNCNFRIPNDKADPNSKLNSFFNISSTETITDPMAAMKSFYTGSIIPSPILRTKSLPVDAMDV